MQENDADEGIHSLNCQTKPEDHQKHHEIWKSESEENARLHLCKDDETRVRQISSYTSFNHTRKRGWPISDRLIVINAEFASAKRS
jgi:hypothetical protein